MARRSPGCFALGLGVILVVVGTIAGGQLFFVGAETMATAFSAFGLANPIVGWALVGGVVGAMTGMLVGLRRAGRRRMLGIKLLAFGVLLLLLLGGILRAGDIIDREIQVPILYSTLVGTENLNVRPSPTTDNTPILSVPEGTRLDVIEERPGWVRVRFTRDGHRQLGWVSRAYVRSPSDQVYDVEMSADTDASVRPPVLIGGMPGLRERLRYPDVARSAGIEGRVTVVATLDPQGRVEAVRVASSPDEMLSYAAMDAVRASRFRPARRDGRPVRVRLTIPIDFEAN